MRPAEIAWESVLDTAVCPTHMRVLACIVFYMGPLHRNPENAAILQFNIQVAFPV